MPEIYSNQDASESHVFRNAMIIAGAAVGIGGLAVGASKLLKGAGGAVEKGMTKEVRQKIANQLSKDASAAGEVAAGGIEGASKEAVNKTHESILKRFNNKANEVAEKVSNKLENILSPLDEKLKPIDDITKNISTNNRARQKYYDQRFPNDGTGGASVNEITHIANGTPYITPVNSAPAPRSSASIPSGFNQNTLGPSEAQRRAAVAEAQPWKVNSSVEDIDSLMSSTLFPY